MALNRRQRVMVGALALYWPTVFVLAHIPIPDVVRQARMSDKSLHFVVYMLLTFMLWSAIKPHGTVQWRKAAAWWVLAIAVVYGVLDECLQHYVAGRSADARDLLADAAGAAWTLGILTVWSFWPAFVAVTGTTIYTLSVFTRANLTAILPIATVVFHFGAYAFFTLVWIGCLRGSSGPGKPARRGLIVSVSVPAALVVVTKFSVMISGKPFEGPDIVAAAAGVLGAFAATSVVGRVGSFER